MFIAFEGPDNVGKSTSAAQLASSGNAIYNATKENHAVQVAGYADEPDLVVTYDRIDWFSHMVYRLALPEHEWNDARSRTVFAMPDTHLVVKIHHSELAGLIQDELYASGKVAQVNPLYYYFADFFMGLNEERDYALFKTVSIVEVKNNPSEGTFTQQLISFSSPSIETDSSVLVDTDQKLLDLLRVSDHASA